MRLGFCLLGGFVLPWGLFWVERCTDVDVGEGGSVRKGGNEGLFELEKCVVLNNSRFEFFGV